MIEPSTPVRVIVESIPTNLSGDILSWVSGCVLPLGLFVASKVFSNRAEKSANEFTIKLHQNQRNFIQKTRLIDGINRLYKEICILHKINRQRRDVEKWIEFTMEINDKVITSGNALAITEHQKNLRDNESKITELHYNHQDTIIDLLSEYSLLTTMIDPSELSKIKELIDKLCVESKKAGGISEELIDLINKELAALSDKVVSDNIKTISHWNDT